MPTPIPTPNAKDMPEKPVIVKPLLNCRRTDGRLNVEVHSSSGETCITLFTYDASGEVKASVVVHRDEIVFLIHALRSTAIELGISNLGDF